MWCDSFDADLLAVVPGALNALGPAAGIRLETYSDLTDGAINCPCAWHTDHGLASFFWTSPDGRPPEAYHTAKPVAQCTFAEAVRDEWVHMSVIVVNRLPVWRPPARLSEQLMYDVRGWGLIETEEREAIRRLVRISLTAAADRLRHAFPALVPGGESRG